MPSRDEVLKAIAEIEDNGNNTASEMRTVLNLLLEHGEDNPISNDNGDSNIETFEIKESGLKEDSNEGSLNYTFRGFTNFHGNLTFSLKFNNIDPGKKDFLFGVNEKFISVMRTLGFRKEKDRLAFVVPMIFGRNDGAMTTIMQIGINQNNLLWLQLNHGFDNMDGPIEIKTSINFHLQTNAED